MITYILLGISLIMLILVIVFFIKLRQPQDLLLHQKLDSLREEFIKNILQAQNNFAATYQGITEHLTRLYKELGNINQESGEILSLTKSFHDVLKPTKRRGVLGESILDNIIKDVLPQDVVVPQYTFRNGRRVDFLLKLHQGAVPIDAKFSLDTFRNYLEAQPDQKDRYRKLVMESVKKGIEETADYILPDEGTVDFAFMYVPSEALYYFIITETDILDYANKKRVFLVGPNTFYVYLNTILVGFQALRIEKKVRVIYDNLRKLERVMENVIREYGILGTHLKSANAKYEEVRKRIEEAQFKLTHADISSIEDEDKS